MRVLILGGTTEATDLVHLLAEDRRFEMTLSLAGRTSIPESSPYQHGLAASAVSTDFPLG